ncbi:MAG: hypothetical protein MJ168_06650 [Clostridia bacterium]|nr:hypothetical protein [Clostridia bacterium]
MKNSCFYYGVFSPDGYTSLMSDSENPSIKKYIVNGYSPAVKQELFDFIKSELEKNKYDYTDLCIADGSGGVRCDSFQICDSFFCPDGEETLLKSFQKTDEKSQKNAEKVLMQREKNLLRCQRFLSACNSIQNDIFRLEKPYVDDKKINRFTTRLWNRISNGLKGHVGVETVRYVTCPTADGIELNMEAFDNYCEKMLVIKDRTGTCAWEIIERIRRYALGSGYDVIRCPCTTNSEITEHIIIPELSFGIFTSKYYHRDDFENSRKIYSKRFLFHSVESIKLRTDFCLRAYRSLMNEVFSSLEEIESCDRKLDEIFYNATDMNALKNYVNLLLF